MDPVSTLRSHAPCCVFDSRSEELFEVISKNLTLVQCSYQTGCQISQQQPVQLSVSCLSLQSQYNFPYPMAGRHGSEIQAYPVRAACQLLADPWQGPPCSMQCPKLSSSSKAVQALLVSTPQVLDGLAMIPSLTRSVSCLTASSACWCWC